MSEAHSLNWDNGGQIEVLTFNMAGETFAIEATMVREILDQIPEIPVPGSAPIVSAVVNFRGKVIPIADLHNVFSLEESDNARDHRVVVIEFPLNDEPCLVGIKADKVNEVTSLEKQATEGAPQIGMRWRPDYIRCLAKRDGDFIIVPDLEHIFSSESLMQDSLLS